VNQWTIGTLLETASTYLREKGSPSPRLDAELLLAETLGLERIHLYTEFDRPLATQEVDGYRALVARRAAREPVAYILGRAYFRHLRLEANRDVLIPRPETEELVEAALALLRRRPPWDAAGPGGPSGAGRSPGPGGPAGRPGMPPLIADVGTGSGAIALSLAQEGGFSVLATDESAKALEVAIRNAGAAGLEALVEFRQADLLAGVADGSLHLVISNPPYVTSAAMATLAPDIRLFEPVSALDAGPDGLAALRRLLPQAARVLRPGGSVLVEVGDGQAAAVERLAREAGFCLVTVRKELSQKDRIVEATLAGAFSCSPADLDGPLRAALAGALEAGAVIGIPTDTVYGLAARWDSPPGIRALFAAKGRPTEQPVAVMFASVDAAKNALPDLGPAAATVLEALLPGPFTFVVDTAVSRPSLVGTPDSLGVRVPDYPALLGLIESLETPLAATSANRTGEQDPTSLADVDPAVLAHCCLALVARGEAEAAGSASTVVDLRPLSAGQAPVILREGTVPATVVLERIAAL
jgi:release factor glutamine methyltransferase